MLGLMDARTRSSSRSPAARATAPRRPSRTSAWSASIPAGRSMSPATAASRSRAPSSWCKVATEDEVLEVIGAFLQLYREEGWYLERTVQMVRRVGLDYDPQAGGRRCRQPQGAVRALRVFAAIRAERSLGGARRRGVDRNEFTPLAGIGARMTTTGSKSARSTTFRVSARACVRTPSGDHRGVPHRRRRGVRARRSLPAQGRAAVAGHRAQQARDLSAAQLRHRARQRPGGGAGRRLHALASGAKVENGIVWLSIRQVRGRRAEQRARAREDHLSLLRRRLRRRRRQGCGWPGQRRGRSGCIRPISAGCARKGSALGRDDRSRRASARARRRRAGGELGRRARPCRRRFRRIIREHGPDAVAFYVSGQLLTEDYYVANKLMKGFIGTANIDTNSRLCMASSVAGHKRAFGSDIVPGCYEDLEQADLVVLVGTNTAWCHPVLYQRMLAAKEATRHAASSSSIRAAPRPAKAPICICRCAPAATSVLFNGLLAYLADNDAVDRRLRRRSHQRRARPRCEEVGGLTRGADRRRLRRSAEGAVELFFDWFAQNRARRHALFAGRQPVEQRHRQGQRDHQLPSR